MKKDCEIIEAPAPKTLLTVDCTGYLKLSQEQYSQHEIDIMRNSVRFSWDLKNQLEQELSALRIN